MSLKTQPFFIVSSGRSGTQMMEKLLSVFPEVEIYHEYLCTHVQPLAVRYYMGLASLDEVCENLARLHGRAVYYSPCRLWGDSSNKLSWLIEGLNILFPTAKFIHLVRDGRKVVSSFYHKLAAECYDDRSTAILQAYVDDPVRHPAPPPEKKYWWNLPRPGSPLAEDFRRYSQFERICFHWGEVNRFILDKLKLIDPSRKRTYKLENLVSDRRWLADMLDFLDLPYQDELFNMLKRPHNVNVPEDHLLTEEQKSTLMAIAGDMMRYFGYDQTEEYRMVYENNPLRRSP